MKQLQAVAGKPMDKENPQLTTGNASVYPTARSAVTWGSYLSE
jgi:hypothetical protein